MKKTVKASSPGRINIIGEHTDYNGGFVLPAAINKFITAEVSLNGHPSRCHLKALDIGEEAVFDWEENPNAQTGWANYLIGVIQEMRHRGAELSGVDIAFGGNVPVGSGMSSSAALVGSVSFALNELFNAGFSRVELAELSQKGEHKYVGTMCGIMDQFASLLGKEESAVFLDCRSLEYEYIPLELGDYEIVIINSNVKHSHAESGYNDRTRECAEGVAALQKYYPEVQLLRDADRSMLDKIKGDVSETVMKRCTYIVEENQRVLEALDAMRAGKLDRLGELLYKAHEGMSKQYEISCPELDWLVESTREKDYILGARLMGGGFGGCTINLIEKSHSRTFTNEITPAFEAEFGFPPVAYHLNVEGGTRVV